MAQWPAKPTGTSIEEDVKKMIDMLKKDKPYGPYSVTIDGLTYVRDDEGNVTALSWCCESECYSSGHWWICKACGAKKAK